MRLKKYRPRFFTGFEDQYFEVNSREELLESDLCRTIIEDGYIICLFDNTLMAINNDKWWVVSIIDSKEDIEQLKDWVYELKEFPRYKFKNVNFE